MRLRKRTLIGLGLLLGLAVPWLLGGHGVWRRLLDIPAAVFALAVGFTLLGWHCNAGRLRLLVGSTGRHMGQWHAFAVAMATDFGYMASPGGAGGWLAWAWLLRRHAGLGTARSLALYAADRLLDLLFFSFALLTFGLVWAFATGGARLGWRVLLLLAGMAALGTLAWLLVRYFDRLLRALLWTLRLLRVSPRRRWRLARSLMEFHTGLGVVLRLPRARRAALAGLCVLHWSLRYSVLYVMVRGLGHHLPWAYTFVVQLVALYAGQITLMPGGSGGAELVAGALLVPYLGRTDAAAAVLGWRLITFYWYLVAGGLVFWLLAGRVLWRRLTAGRP